MRRYVCLVHFDKSDKVFKTFVNADDRKSAMDCAYRRAKDIHSHDEWIRLGKKRIEAVVVEPNCDGV